MTTNLVEMLIADFLRDAADRKHMWTARAVYNTDTLDAAKAEALFDRAYLEFCRRLISREVRLPTLAEIEGGQAQP